jgi:hypothetical protein
VKKKALPTKMEKTSWRTWRSNYFNQFISPYSDYKAVPELDRYEGDGLDDGEQ